MRLLTSGKKQLICLMVMCIPAITGYTQGNSNSKAKEPVPVYLDETQPIESRIKDALSRMTVEEKVFMSAAQSKFSSPGVPRLGIPEVWMTDGPFGIRYEMQWDSWNTARQTNDSCTAFPALTCLAASWNPELSFIFGKAVAEEARYRDKDVLLGPGVNIYRTPMNGRNFEYMGEDPYLAARLAVPYIKGVQENGVAACVKHFALNNQEHWRMDVNIELSDRALHEIYLPAFKAAVIEGGSWTIMGAFNKIRGQFACHNEMMINKILKKDWGFDGAVISDWGGTHDTKEAIYNGLDIEMGSHTEYLGKNYMALAQTGEVPMDVIDEKASRVLRLIFRTAMNANKPWGSFSSPEHAKVSREIAEEGIVLLKNSNNLLPVNAASYKTIAVIGENAVMNLTENGGSSELKVRYEVSPLQGLTNMFGADKVKFSKGYTSDKVAREIRSTRDSLYNSAVDLAKNSDVVIYFGGLNKRGFQDCEGQDRQSFEIPFNQDTLISAILKANKNVIIVLFGGNAVAMPWIKEASTLVQAWYLGTEAGNAIANVLSGKVNPSGKLPFSYPKKLEDNGAISFGPTSYPGIDKTVTYKEDILVGYRWFDTKKIEPLFPFGYGLSYTTFQYGELKVDKKKMAANEKLSISIPVTNTGKTVGSEIVQLYIKDKKCSVLRPEKELKAFAKVKLQPGETKQVDFQIDENSLHFYDDKAQKWVVEPGVFIAFIGSSSRDLKKNVEFEVK